MCAAPMILGTLAYVFGWGVLYTMRQVRRAQGAATGSVERLWVLTDSAAPRRELLQAIEGTHTAQHERSAAQFPGKAEEHIYLIDPLGNLMMRFAPNPDPSRMVKDLERLLKYSGIG